MRTSKPILLVEDDNVDAMTVKRALKDLKVTNTLVHQLNGEDALNYLRTAGNGRPCVIVLDLNMPKINGLEFLKIIKADPEMRQIPVIVLTTSKDEQDKLKSFRMSAAGYIVKPTDYKKLVEAIKTVGLYWTLVDLYWTLSELPCTV